MRDWRIGTGLQGKADFWGLNGISGVEVFAFACDIELRESRYRYDQTWKIWRTLHGSLETQRHKRTTPEEAVVF